MNERKTSGDICADPVPLRRLRLALWAYENNPPDDVFRRRLIEAYEALRVYGG